MPFKGITFAGQNVTPKNDGGLYQAHYGDGILWGCSMAISGDDLVIQSGEFIAGGRMCQVDGATNVDLSTRTLTNGYIQVVMDFDISKPEGEQWNIHLPLIESATTTFPALTRDNINDTGTLYQLQLAVVQISGGNLTSITSSLAYGGLVSHGVTYFLNNTTDARQAKIDIQNVESGNGVIMGLCGSDGETISGYMGLSDGTAVFSSGSGGHLYFRPNGINNSSGQIEILSSGQRVGGVISSSFSKSSATNITNGTSWTTLVDSGANSLVSSGLYLVIAYGTYTPNTSTLHTPWIRLAGIAENRVSPGNFGIPFYVVRWVTGATRILLEVNPQNASVTTATVSANATIQCLRIA